MKLLVGSLCAAAVAWPSGEVAASPPPLQWRLMLESGAEYDSNVHRVEQVEDENSDVDASPLMRAGARLRLSWRRGERQRLVIDGWGGGKLFADDAATNENIAIIDTRAGYEWGIKSRGAVVALRGDYYDTFSPDTGAVSDYLVLRNFASANGELALTVVGPGSNSLTVHGGYRDFRYKPDEDFDWRGEHYGLDFRTTIWRGDPESELDTSIDVNMRYRLTRRSYQGLAYRNKCADDDDIGIDCLVPTLALGRADLHHQAAAAVAYTGERIWSAGYQLFVNDSNSFGQSYLRHRFGVGVTTESWAGIFVTARAAVQLITFIDPLLLLRSDQAEVISIDDENRNSLSLHLSRDVDESWSVEGRYVLYTNEFASQEFVYRRQTAYLGLVYNFAP